MSKNKNKRIGVVYSTNPDYQYQYDHAEPEAVLSPFQQHLTVLSDKKQRGGKQVTLVKGFVGPSETLSDVCRMLKTQCGVGGCVKNGEILLQGDFRNKVSLLLRTAGYQVKQSGG